MAWSLNGPTGSAIGTWTFMFAPTFIDAGAGALLGTLEDGLLGPLGVNALLGTLNDELLGSALGMLAAGAAFGGMMTWPSASSTSATSKAGLPGGLSTRKGGCTKPRR